MIRRAHLKHILYVLALGRYFPISMPTVIRPTIAAPVLAKGPISPDVEALVLNMTSKYFGRNWAKPTIPFTMKMFESNVNK